MSDLKTYPVIGAKYSGPVLDRDCLRTLPHGWQLEEAKPDYSAKWHRRVEVWALIVVALWLLVGAAQIGGWK